jgi:hypothetical protein
VKYEYLFKEFQPDVTEEQINVWLERVGAQEWEAVNVTPMLHLGGGLNIGGIALPPTPRCGYTFLMKRPLPKTG